MISSPNPPASPSALPSPPTSPTAATAARTRVKVPRRPCSLGNVPATTNPEGERTKNVSFSLSKTVSADLDMPGSENMTIAPSVARRVVAGKRRKPSITYYTPSSPSPWSQRPRMHRISSSSVDVLRDAEVVVTNGEENVSRRSSLVLGSRSPSTRESVCSADGVGAREREPLTLVEKHVDLLHLIAQKERKCLELRDQLAVHEKDLAELKRKWERIVNRGYDPHLNSPLAAGLGGVALDGLKESVRIFAAGFSDLGPPIQELDSSDEQISRAQSLTHSPCGRSNALNTSAKRAGGEHPSPTPSIQEGARASDQPLGDQGGIVATAPSLSRTGSLNRRVHKRASRTFGEEPTTLSGASVSSPRKPKPADLDVCMSLILAPSSMLVRPPSENAKPALARSGLKSPVLGSAWTAVPMSAGPVSSWMDSMGKKLSELQKGQTFSKSQKRASSLFAGVSNSITSALSPGPTPTTPAPAPHQTLTSTPTPTPPRIRPLTMPPSTSPASTQSSLITVSPPPQPQPHLQSRSHPSPSCKATMDWFEDDEEQQTSGVLLIPDSKRQPVSVRATDAGGETVATAIAISTFDDDDDDDDWNW